MTKTYVLPRLCLCLCLLWPAACTRLEETPRRDELVVAMRNTPAFVQETGEGAGEGGRMAALSGAVAATDAGTKAIEFGEVGFERELVEQFANTLGLNLRVILVRSQGEMLTLVREGKAHMAASAMRFADSNGIRYTAPLRQSPMVLVQSAASINMDTLPKLAGHRIEALSGSLQVPVLLRLASQAGRESRTAADVPLKPAAQRLAPVPASVTVMQPAFQLSVQQGLNEIELLGRVSERRSELAATDRLHYDIATGYFPDLQIAQELDHQVGFAWAFPAAGDARLFDRAQQFIKQVRQDGTVARLNDRYFGHTRRLDAQSVSRFMLHIGKTLPAFRTEFVNAQEITGIDWRLIAALAYQESQWDPLATSPTNVRGIMMLTEDTADHLKVTNRLDARQSIRAGARYLADIIDNLPPEIPQPDRTWMAIAAYNLGQGHMNGARVIARSLKRDANSWFEMKAVLPLLMREEYYRRLKSGRARGGEAVILVENVRKFYDILQRFEEPHPTALRLWPTAITMAQATMRPLADKQSANMAVAGLAGMSANMSSAN